MNALLRRLSLPCLLPVGLAASLLVGPGAGPAAPLAAPPADGADADLERCMTALKVNLKTVAAGLAREGAEHDTLKALAAMQVWTLKGKSLSPPNLDDIPEARQEAHAKAFRASMAQLLLELTRTEIDILEGNRTDALERVKGSLLELRESAHEKFQGN